MRSQKSKEFIYFKVPIFFVDLVVHLTVLYVLINFLLPDGMVPAGMRMEEGVSKPVLGFFALMTMSFFFAIACIGLKLNQRGVSIWTIIHRAIQQTAIAYILMTTLVAMVYKNVPRNLLSAGFCISTPLIVFCHVLVVFGIGLIRKSGRNIRKVVFIGADVTAQRVYKALSKGYSFNGYKLEGFFSSLDEVTLPDQADLLGRIDDFWEWIEKHDVDELYCSLPPATCQEIVNRIIHICNDKFIDFYFVPNFEGYPKRHLQVDRLDNVNIIKLREERLNTPLAKAEKRFFDILISGLFLITVYPFVVLFVLIGNKLGGNSGPLYFRQARTGYNGNSFMIYKFRSMRENKEADTLQATKDDPRKTPFGDFLRRSSIDELPQFINVLKGDMSIIGPRPHMEYHTDLYRSLVNDYMVRHHAKPGITGWAQTNGCRGETQTVEQMKDRVERDIWYIEHWSPSLDAEIFFKTIWQLLPGHDKQAY